jgi:hypothetical protein
MRQLTETVRILSFKAVIKLATISLKLSLATEIWNRNFEENTMNNLFLTEEFRLAT